MDEKIKALSEELDALKEEIRYYKEIIRVMPGMVYWKDKEGKLKGCNDNVLKTLQSYYNIDPIGWTFEELAKRTEKEYTGQQSFENDIWVMENNTPLHTEEKGFNQNGKDAVYLVQKNPLHSKKGDVTGLVGISVDITKQKELEVCLKKEKEIAEEANAAKSQFLSTVNHELRTPVVCILSLVELLQAEELNSDIQKMLLNLDSAAKHLLEVVNAVLDFNRIEQEQNPTEIKAFSMRELSQSVIAMLENVALKKQLKFHAYLSNNLPAFLLSDTQYIRRILINLISNAIKFTRTGMINVKIDYDTQLKNLLIEVADTGIGIAKKDMERIFLPFQQAEDSYVKQNSLEGTGLGLPIVKSLVEKLKGYIKVKSKLGQGSTFSVHLPCLEARDKPDNTKPTSPLPALPADLKILIIEDDPIIQFINQKIFEKIPLKVTMTKSGREGLSILENYDVLFLDLTLSDISGFEVITAIRSRTDQHKDIPIILLTAHSEDMQKYVLELGGDLFVPKPLKPNEIHQIILSAFEKAKARKKNKS